MAKRNLTQRQIKFLFAVGILRQVGKGKVSFNKDRSREQSFTGKQLGRFMKSRNRNNLSLAGQRSELAKNLIRRRSGVRSVHAKFIDRETPLKQRDKLKTARQLARAHLGIARRMAKTHTAQKGRR